MRLFNILTTLAKKQANLPVKTYATTSNTPASIEITGTYNEMIMFGFFQGIGHVFLAISFTNNSVSIQNLLTVCLESVIADIGVESYEYTVAVTDSKQTVTVKKQTAVICISRLAGGRGVRLFAEAAEEGFWVADIDYTISNAEYLDLARLLATAYSATSPYTVGDFVTYNSNVYECNTACSAAAWTTNSSKFTLLGSA